MARVPQWDSAIVHITVCGEGLSLSSVCTLGEVQHVFLCLDKLRNAFFPWKETRKKYDGCLLKLPVAWLSHQFRGFNILVTDLKKECRSGVLTFKLVSIENSSRKKNKAKENETKIFLRQEVSSNSFLILLGTGSLWLGGFSRSLNLYLGLTVGEKDPSYLQKGWDSGEHNKDKNSKYCTQFEEHLQNWVLL